MWHLDTADCVYVLVLREVPSAKQSMFSSERSYNAIYRQDSDTVFSSYSDAPCGRYRMAKASQTEC